MQKKKYVNPQMEVVETEMQQVLLAGSVFEVEDELYDGVAGANQRGMFSTWED